MSPPRRGLRTKRLKRVAYLTGGLFRRTSERVPYVLVEHAGVLYRVMFVSRQFDVRCEVGDGRTRWTFGAAEDVAAFLGVEG